MYRGYEQSLCRRNKIAVESGGGRAVQLTNGTTVGGLINGIVQVSPRDIIVILQSIKKAGALQADIVVE